jgi:cell division protein FtsQ
MDDARIVVDLTAGRRRGLLGRRVRSNRKITFESRSLLDAPAALLMVVGRKLLVVGKLLAVLVLGAASAWAGREIVRHVIASPRFAVREIRVGPTQHVSAEEIAELSGVQLGDRLLAIDPNAVAATLARHPWIASARVRRELPSVLAVDVVEHEAAASALVGALYLLDDSGRPFKRATFDEADGLPVITGVTREQYAAMRSASEAVFREAIALGALYKAGPAARPRVSEIHVDPRAGFSLVLLDGGAEVRLGRGDFEAKLTRFDRIVGALDQIRNPKTGSEPPAMRSAEQSSIARDANARGPASLGTVYLDGPAADRVTLRLAPTSSLDSASSSTAPAPGGKPPSGAARSTARRGT